MNIVIVHLKRSGLKVHPLIKVDRSTILGNRFSHLEHSKAEVKVDTVDQAVAEFDNWLCSNWKRPDISQQLNFIYQLALTHETIYLGCWCMDELDPKPKDHNCHCTVIRKVCYRRYQRETGHVI